MLKDRINQLKEYFSKEPSVVMAYIFGSYAKDRVMSESDIDIAVYFKPEDREIEYEKDREYPDEDRVWADVERIKKFIAEAKPVYRELVEFVKKLL